MAAVMRGGALPEWALNYGRGRDVRDTGSAGSSWPSVEALGSEVCEGTAPAGPAARRRARAGTVAPQARPTAAPTGPPGRQVASGSWGLQADSSQLGGLRAAGKLRVAQGPTLLDSVVSTLGRWSHQALFGGRSERGVLLGASVLAMLLAAFLAQRVGPLWGLAPSHDKPTLVSFQAAQRGTGVVCSPAGDAAGPERPTGQVSQPGQLPALPAVSNAELGATKTRLPRRLGASAELLAGHERSDLAPAVTAQSAQAAEAVGRSTSARRGRAVEVASGRRAHRGREVTGGGEKARASAVDGQPGRLRRRGTRLFKRRRPRHGHGRSSLPTSATATPLDPRPQARLLAEGARAHRQGALD